VLGWLRVPSFRRQLLGFFYRPCCRRSWTSSGKGFQEHHARSSVFVGSERLFCGRHRIVLFLCLLLIRKLLHVHSKLLPPTNELLLYRFPVPAPPSAPRNLLNLRTRALDSSQLEPKQASKKIRWRCKRFEFCDTFPTT
jgi:hypothetical protein